MKQKITPEHYRDLLLALQQTSFIEWIIQNKIKNERGEELEFRKHLFMYDIYNDWSPRQAIVKSSQIGGSVMMVLKAFYAAGMKNYNVIYTLPSFDFVRKFVPDKVGKVVEKNINTLGVWLKSGQKDTLDQKQVNDRTIYFDSAFEHESNIGTSSKGISLTSDLNIHDESNRSSLAIMSQYESRLDYSEYKGIWMFSNPTYPNVGVSEWWNRSDQKHWFIKCNHCNYQQYMDWELNVDYELEQYVCQKCHKVLTDENRRVGQWVRKWENKDISGYWINQMMAPWKSAKDLIKLEDEKSKQYFYNFALGLPYAGSDVVVDRDLILKNITTKESSKTNVCIGVDVGLVKHVVIGTPYGVFKIFTTPDWKVIEQEFLKYDATMVIDALPDLTIPRELVQKYRGKVFINYYKEGTIAKKESQFKKDDKYGVVFTDRTRMIELAVDGLAKGITKFHLKSEELNEFIKHWESMYRYTDSDRQGNPVVRWESANNVDHFVHSYLYYLIAIEKASSTGGAIFQDSVQTHGTEAYNPQAPSITEFMGKPDKDWRYI